MRASPRSTAKLLPPQASPQMSTAGACARPAPRVTPCNPARNKARGRERAAERRAAPDARRAAVLVDHLRLRQPVARLRLQVAMGAFDDGCG